MPTLVRNRVTRRGGRWEFGKYFIGYSYYRGWRLRELPVVLRFDRYVSDTPGGAWILYLYSSRICEVDHLLDPAMADVERDGTRTLGLQSAAYRNVDEPAERVIGQLLDSGFTGTLLELSDAVTAIVRDRPRF